MQISKKGRKSRGEDGGSKRVYACAIHYWADPQPNPQQRFKIKLPINFGWIFLAFLSKRVLRGPPSLGPLRIKRPFQQPNDFPLIQTLE